MSNIYSDKIIAGIKVKLTRQYFPNEDCQNVLLFLRD